MAKQVLGIVGSPRRGGNTECLIEEVLRGAQEAGASVDKVILHELEIAPCDACDACLETGECVHGDDMPELFERMAKSPVWVLGTPIYWWGPTAQFKLFVDRWYGRAHREEDKALFKGKRVILVIPFGDSSPETARHVQGMMQDTLSYVEAKLVATVLAPGVNERGEVRQRPELMAAAYAAGQGAFGR